MGERTEYWWVRYDSEVGPARVGFVGGIPARIWMIGMSDMLPATAVELIERLPQPPEPVLRQPERPPEPAPQKRSGSLLWLVGILLLIFVAQCSGSIFDAIK